MTSDEYASTILTLITLVSVSIGLIAMLVRAIARHHERINEVAHEFVRDVKRGKGFVGTGQVLRNEPPPPQRLPQPPSQPEAEKHLFLRQWLDLVNSRPDEVPHLFIEGGSGAGKTTLATTILNDRGGPIAVVGIKPDDGWGVGYVFRSNERENVLSLLLTETRRRLDENDQSGLTIVLDDFTRLSDHKVAVELYKLVADVGRSLRIRLILIARGRLVKGIGASGESDLRDHFVFITVRRDHRAFLEFDEESFLIDSSRVRELAQPIPQARWWQPQAQRVAPTRSDNLLRLFGDDPPIPVRHADGQIAQDSTHTSMGGMSGTTHQDAIPVDSEEGGNTGGIPATLTSDAIRTLYSGGWSKNRIAGLLTGSKQKRLSSIDSALAEERAEVAAS